MINKYCNCCNKKIDVDYEEYKMIKNKFYCLKCAERIKSKDYKDEKKLETKISIIKILIWVAAIVVYCVFNGLLGLIAGVKLGWIFAAIIFVPINKLCQTVEDKMYEKSGDNKKE